LPGQRGLQNFVGDRLVGLNGNKSCTLVICPFKYTRSKRLQVFFSVQIFNQFFRLQPTFSDVLKFKNQNKHNALVQVDQLLVR
jgi:hypothetical protein